MSGSANVAQHWSHAHLTQDVSQLPVPSSRSRSGRLDAIIVPASRPASLLQPVIDLAASLDVLLVMLCSRQTSIEQVAQRVARTPGARCLLVPIAQGWTHPAIPPRTSAAKFRVVQGGRTTDLSAKRNLGLLLARLHGWAKIAFVDDDIRISTPEHFTRLAGQLEAHRVAGMVVEEYPDNSVVCHARRLADLDQDVFVSGAVLGVRLDERPLSFFPDVYNEDWFFFAEEAASRKLPRVGQATQTEYDPFATSERAGWEEFGDLLAEGLFALFGDVSPELSLGDHLNGATDRYWSRFIEARQGVLTHTRGVLERFADRDPGNLRVHSAIGSLKTAEALLDSQITPGLCVDFIEAWREDLADWHACSRPVTDVGTTREAMDYLGLGNWRLAEFGCAEVDDPRGAQRLIRPATA